MTIPIIIDTSALISLVSEDDSNYKRATEISRELQKVSKIPIVPGEIFTEFMNVLGKKSGHDKAVEKGKIVLESTEYKIIETSLEVRGEAFKKFVNQPRSVSFTDCLVMAFADFFETKEIFGFDRVFRKNNYVLPGHRKARKAS